MGKTKTVLDRTARIVLVAFAAQLVPVVPVIEAPAEAATGIDSVSPGFDPTMPPQFNMAQIAGQAAQFQSCNGLQAAAASGLQNLGNLASGMTSGNSLISNSVGMQGMGSMGFGINAACTGSDVGPSADSISCDTLTLADGTIDTGALQAKANAIQLAIGNVQCKKNKFAAIQAQLQCLTAQADALTQQLTAVQGAYQNNIQRMQQDVVKINQVISDRQSEDQDVLTRLNGDSGSNGAPGNGSKGLIGVRDGLCQALTGAPCGSTGGAGASGGGGGAASGILSGGPDSNSIPGQIRILQNQMTDAQNKQQQLTEAINERTMGLAGDCFNNRKVPSFQCQVNGPPVSAHDYILCMYQQKLGVGSDGQVDPSAMNGGFKANQNQAKEQSLSALLDSIMADVPQKTPAAPTDPNAAPDPSQMQAATILTAADVETQYGTQLSGFDTSSMPIHDFVMKNIGACFQRAENVVNQEKDMASSPIGQQEAALTKAQGDLQTNANQMLSMNVSKYEEAMTALTGMNMPLNTGKCNNGTPAVQIACLQDLQQNMEALLHGSAKQSTVTMNLTGTDPNTNISFQCQGLDGCIAALQNVDRNLQSEVKRVQAFKTQYVTAAKQSVDNFTKQMAAMMSSQSASLNNQLKQLNSALASLGVGGGISIPPVQCEQDPPDNDGLPSVPQSALKVIGCAMNPPMLDVSGNDFSSALSNVAQGQKDVNDKLGPLNEALNKLATMQRSCSAKLATKRSEQLNTDLQQLASGNCQYITNFCQTNQQAFANLGNDISSLDGTNGLDLSGASGSLAAGMNCNDPQARTYQKNQACLNCTQTYSVGPDLVACMRAAGLPDDMGTKDKPCQPMANGVAPNTGICNGIATRLQRDVDRLKSIDRSTAGSASGAF